MKPPEVKMIEMTQKATKILVKDLALFNILNIIVQYLRYCNTKDLFQSIRSLA